MHIRALRTLVTIAKLGAFTATADQLRMTPSAVSMQMKTLESDLGVKLFARDFRPPMLTPLGRQVAERASELLAAEEQLLELCRGKDDLAGLFRIGFVATASVRLLPGFLDKVAESAPGAQFNVVVDVSETLERKVASGLMDAAIITAPSSPSPTLQYEVLREEHLVFAIPRAEKLPSRNAAVESLPFLQFTPDTGIGILIARHMAEHADIQPPHRMVLNNVEAIMQCVNRGIGYTLLPEPDVQLYADQSMVEIKQPATKLTRQLALVTLPTSPIGLQKDLVVGLFS